MRGERLYNIVRGRLDGNPREWPSWLDLTSDERRAWIEAEDDVYDSYGPDVEF